MKKNNAQMAKKMEEDQKAINPSKGGKMIVNRPTLTIVYSPYDASVIYVGDTSGFRPGAKMKDIVEYGVSCLLLDSTEIDVPVLKFEEFKASLDAEIESRNQKIVGQGLT